MANGSITMMTDNTSMRNIVENQSTKYDYTSESSIGENQTTEPDYYGAFPCFTMYCIYELRYRSNHYDIILCMAIILAILGSTGFIGNTLVLIVLIKSKLKQTSVYFMIFLSIIDLMACGIVIPGIIVTEWHFKFESDFFCKLWEFLRYFTIPTSAMILVAIACERCLIICFAPKRLSKNLAMFIIALILLFGTGFGVPPVLGMGVYSGNGVYMGYCLQNYKEISLAALDTYWMAVTTFFIIMIVIIILSYTAIFFTIVNHNRRWQRSRTNRVNPTSGLQNINVCPRKSTSDAIFATRASETLLHCQKKTDFTTNTNVIQDTVSTSENQSLVEKRKKSMDIPHVSKPESEENISTLNKHKLQITTKNENLNSKLPTEAKESKCKHERFSLTKRLSLPGKVTPEDAESNKRDGKTTWFDEKKKLPSNQRGVLIKISRRTHIKTTQVLFTVTVVYVASFLPTFLISHELLPQFKGQKVLFLMYFLNNAANPIIYSFMNVNFRKEIWKTLCCCNTKRMS